MTEKSVFAALEKLLLTEELPALGPQPRPSRQSIGVLEASMRTVLQDTGFDSAKCDTLRSIVLLWHDHLDAAHTICQDIHNADGSFVHAIMHRREPDYWNSKYWFNRVGRHAAFETIARRVDALLEGPEGDRLRSLLLPNGNWNSAAFVDLCEEAAGKPGVQDAVLLQRIQDMEFKSLLEHVCSS